MAIDDMHANNTLDCIAEYPLRTIDSPSPDLVSVRKDEAPIVEEEALMFIWPAAGTVQASKITVSLRYADLLSILPTAVSVVAWPMNRSKRSPTEGRTGKVAFGSNSAL
ncbi:hypothetical protein Tco_1284399 [Tanacetum coccineum]